MDDLSERERRVVEYAEETSGDGIAVLRELIQTKPVNPPGKEGRAAALIEPRLSALGFEVETYEPVEDRPNYVGRRPGGDGPTLLLNAHMDVVPAREPETWPCDPFEAEFVDGKLYGRGACDHLSPIVAMLSAVEALDVNDVTLGGDLLFVFDADAERGGEVGMKHVVENADLDADVGIYAMTTGLTDEAAASFPTMGTDNVMRANVGNQVYEVTVEGRVEHPLAPAETEGAGERLSMLLPELRAYCDGVCSRSAPLVGDLDAQLTTFESEGRPGRASPEARAYVRRDYAPSEDADEVFAEFEAFVADAVDELGLGDAVSVERVEDVPAVEVPEDHPLVASTRRASRLVRDRDPTVTGVPAQTGIARLAEQFDVPVVGFGYGNANLHHAEPEWIDPDDVIDMAKAYALTFMDLLGVEDD